MRRHRREVNIIIMVGEKGERRREEGRDKGGGGGGVTCRCMSAEHRPRAPRACRAAARRG